MDKTPFIEDIEDSNKYFFFISPRRFGKTLTLSMLENYYDINKKDNFEEIFGKWSIWVGQNPTPERNQLSASPPQLCPNSWRLGRLSSMAWTTIADAVFNLLRGSLLLTSCPKVPKKASTNRKMQFNQLSYLCTTMPKDLVRRFISSSMSTTTSPIRFLPP